MLPRNVDTGKPSTLKKFFSRIAKNRFLAEVSRGGRPAAFWAKALGWAASGITLLVAVALPAISGPVVLSTSVALQVITVLTLVWTAVFAAENLRELQLARVSDFLPILSLHPPSELYPLGGPRRRFEVDVRNFGHGPAVDLKVRLWRRDGLDRDEWFSTLLPVDQPVLGPGEKATAVGPLDHSDLWFKSIIGRSIGLSGESPVGPDFVLEAEYRDPFNGTHRKRYPYAERENAETGTRQLTALPEAECPELRKSDRVAIVRETLQEMLSANEMPEYELEITADAATFSINVTIRGRTVGFSRDAKQPAQSVAVDVMEDIRQCLKRGLWTDDDP